MSIRNALLLFVLSMTSGCATSRNDPVPIYNVDDLILISNKGVTQSVIDDFGGRHGYSTLPGGDLPKGWAIVEGAMSMAEYAGLSFDQVVNSKSFVIRSRPDSSHRHIQDRAVAVRLKNNKNNRAWYSEIDKNQKYVQIRILTYIDNEKNPCRTESKNPMGDRYFCIGPLKNAEIIR